VNRSGGLASGVGISYATSNGTATAGSDYTSTSGTLTFNGGVTSQTFTVPILQDSLVEGNETFNVALSSATGGGTLGSPSSAVVTIVDDEQRNVEVALVPRIVESASDTSATLPTSDRSPFWTLEGGNTSGTNDFYVEIWVRSDQVNPAAISGGTVNITFNPQYVHAVAVDHGSVFTTLPVANIDNTAGVVSIGGGTLSTDKGIQSYVLLGRVEFQGNAPVNKVAHQAGPYNMSLAVATGPTSFAEVGIGNVGTTFDAVPTAMSMAVIYDIDDSGLVDFGDFSYFASAFLKTVGSPEPPYTWWADFDGSGTVDFGDFSYFATAFLKAFSDPGIKFPATDPAVELRVVSSAATSDHMSDADFAGRG